MATITYNTLANLKQAQLPQSKAKAKLTCERQKMSTEWVKKKCDLKKHGHNCSEIHQKGKKLVCSGKFSLNAAG